MAVLVFSLPPTEGYHEHAKGLVVGPESVFDAGTNKELVVGLGVMDSPIQFEIGPIIEEMKELISDLV